MLYRCSCDIKATSKLKHRPVIISVTKTNRNNEVKNDDNVEVRHGYITLDYLMNNYIKKYIGHIFLNAPGAPFDVFEFLNTSIEEHKVEILFLAKQMKLTDIGAVTPMIINQELFDKEH